MNESSRNAENLTRMLGESLARRGVVSFGFLDGGRLRRAALGMDPRAAEAYGLSACRGAVVAALPYDTTGLPAGSMDPAAARDSSGRLLGDIGWFARSNAYRGLSLLFRAAAAEVRAAGGWSKSDFRIAVNSRIPEKPLAFAAGLGFQGRNTLVLDRVLGPGCVLGALLLPFEPVPESPRAPEEGAGGSGAFPEGGADPPSGYGSACGNCDLCARACPTGAIGPNGLFDKELCIQYWASTDAPVPPGVAERWRGNLYGCDLCLAACPLFRSGVQLAPGPSRLGPGLPLSWILTAEDARIRGALKGSALGLGWITPALLRRNALLAAASRTSAEGFSLKDKDVQIIRSAAERYVRSGNPSLTAAAARFLDIPRQGI